MSDTAPERDPFPVPVPPEAREVPVDPEPEVVSEPDQPGEDDVASIPARKSRTPAQIAATKKMQEASAAARSGRKRPRRSRAKGGTPKDPTPTQANAALRREALKSLKQWRAEIGVGGLYVAPLPATYVAQTPDDVLEAAVDLAARNGKVLAALAGGGDVLSGIILLRWAAGLGVTTAVQIGRLPADSVLAQMYGVGDLIDQLADKGLIRVEPIDIDGRPGPDEPGAGVPSPNDGDDDGGPSVFGGGDPAPARVAVV